MTKYIYELCESNTPDAVECRDYNNGEEKRHIDDCNFGGNKLEGRGHTIVYIRPREVSEQELERISADADRWRIYSVAVTYNPGLGILDEYGESDYSREIDYYIEDIEAESYLVSGGAFAGVVHFRKECEGDVANVALITDDFATRCEGDFPAMSEKPPLIYFYNEFRCPSYSTDEYYLTFYLGEKQSVGQDNN